MSRSRVQFLTLAEIAFTMLFALMILSLAQVAEGRRIASERDRVATALLRARTDLLEANRQIKALEQKIKVLEQQHTGKLSNIPPACTGVPLERLTILGPDTFLLQHEHLNAQAIGARHIGDIRWADQNQCRHRVVVDWRVSLPASDFAAALNRLESYFRTVRGKSVEVS